MQQILKSGLFSKDSIKNDNVQFSELLTSFAFNSYELIKRDIISVNLQNKFDIKTLKCLKSRHRLPNNQCLSGNSHQQFKAKNAEIVEIVYEQLI